MGDGQGHERRFWKAELLKNPAVGFDVTHTEEGDKTGGAIDSGFFEPTTFSDIPHEIAPTGQ